MRPWLISPPLCRSPPERVEPPSDKTAKPPATASPAAAPPPAGECVPPPLSPEHAAGLQSLANHMALFSTKVWDEWALLSHAATPSTLLWTTRLC